MTLLSLHNRRSKSIKDFSRRDSKSVSVSDEPTNGQRRLLSAMIPLINSLFLLTCNQSLSACDHMCPLRLTVSRVPACFRVSQ